MRAEDIIRALALIVKMEDFEEIRRLSKFMNLDFHQI
jgi:hypothetical protein